MSRTASGARGDEAFLPLVPCFMLLVGLDCASQPHNNGIACATLRDGRVTVHEARVARSDDDLIDTLSGWLASAPEAVFALDAPLGWPAPMANALGTHQAGGPLAPAANDMFSRATDLVVWRELGKKPMEVGANWLARTAHSALRTLNAVRDRVPVEMGWSPGHVSGRQALEVYPGATLVARGFSARGYKTADATKTRAGLLDALGLDVAPPARAAAIKTDHPLDAILCCVAAADYAVGDVLTPEAAGVDPALAEQESWIWFRPPEA